MRARDIGKNGGRREWRRGRDGRRENRWRKLREEGRMGGGRIGEREGTEKRRCIIKMVGKDRGEGGIEGGRLVRKGMKKGKRR